MEKDYFFTSTYKLIDSVKNNKEKKEEYFIEMNEKNSPENTLKHFYSIYNTTEYKDKKIKLRKSFIRFFWKSYFILFLIRAFNIYVDFKGPMIMGNILGITTKNNILSEEDKYECYYSIVHFILMNFTKILISTYYDYRLDIYKNQLTIILSDMIYKKLLKLPGNISKIEAKVTKMLEDDISNIYNLFFNLNYIWELPFDIIFALYTLYLQVSYSFIPGLLFTIILLIVNYKIAISSSSTNEGLYKSRLKRKENELIAIKNIKSVKFFSMERYFLDKIYYFRAEEFKLLTFKKYLDALCCYFWAASPVLVSFFSIFSYLLSGNLLDAEKVFTTISLLNNIIHPLNVFPWVFSQLKGSFKSFNKIVKLLDKQEVNEQLSLNKPKDNNTDIVLEGVKIRHCVNNGGENNKSTAYELSINKGDPFICKKREITILYGPNGSGKTLLLKSLMNESVIKAEDEALINLILEGVSYVPQELWTFDDTIRENILSGSDVKNYDSLIEVCCLKQDLNTMPNEDSTVITCKGSNISGGQKQRINLARALSSSPKVLILDNAFSAIDNNVAFKIFNNAILPLKEKGVIIVFSTSDKKWLNYADRIYSIENNTVKEYKEDKDSSYVNYDYEQHKNKEIGVKKEEDEGAKAEIKNDNNTSDNNTSNQHVKLEVILYYFKQFGYFACVIFIMFVCMMQFGKNYIEIWLADWVKFDKDSTDEEKFELQKRNTKMYLIFVILHSLVTTGRAFSFAIAGLRACRKIYKTFIEKLLYTKHKFHTDNNVGKITNLLQNDILIIDEGLPFELNRLVAYTFSLAGSIFVIAYSSYFFIFLFIVIGVYYLNLFNQFNPTSIYISKKIKDINEPFINLFLNTADGISVIRAHKKQGYFLSRFEKLLNKKTNLIHTSQVLGSWLSVRLDMIAFSLYSLIIIMIGICVKKETYELITFLSLALTYAMNITGPLSSFLPWININEERFQAVERVYDKIQEVVDERTISSSINEIQRTDGPLLEFKNVCMKYNKTDAKHTLEDISFQVFSGQRIGIIGRTGAGKSTIFSLLFNLYDAEKGEILFYNKNIKDVQLTALRKNMIVIPKDNILFEATLKDNIDFDNKFTDKEFEEFLSKFSNLFNKKEFELFRDINYYVENSGCNLSEGQKSLIQILRGLLKNPYLLCLDESNGELDDETEKILFDIIFNSFKATTFIIIAHKLNILDSFDMIIVIDNGRIVDIGQPKMILKNQNYISNMIIN